MPSKEEYFDMAVKTFFVQENGNRESYEKLFSLMVNYLYNTLGIRSLYRYRPSDKWQRDKVLFESDKIWFQPMGRQNDPLEFSFEVDVLPSLNGSVIKNFCDSLISKFDAFKDRCSIACFSDSNDNICLWEGYANKNQGYCVEYSVIDILNQFQCFLLPVIYQDEIPTLSNALSCAESDRDFLPYYIVYKRISTKLVSWAEEKEWRVICTLKSAGGAVQFPKPTAVYLGYEADNSFKSDMTQICEKKNVPIFKMRKSKATNKLKPTQI